MPNSADDRTGGPAFRVGHWTDRDAVTGCTVMLFDDALATVVEVRGGSPGTRETDLLAPGALVGRADAILLSGGSAFGLGAAQGVMSYLANRGRGVATAAGNVPIVPAAILYDLAVGRPIAPSPEDAVRASAAAVEPAVAETGRVGAGTGATIDKLAGTPRPGGVGIASRGFDGVQVWAVVVVNAAGVVDGDDPRPMLLESPQAMGERESTTLAVVVIDGPADDRARRRCAFAAHDGMARRIRPCHTIWDGDVVFVSSRSDAAASPDVVFGLSVAAELAVEDAIEVAVR